MDKPTKPAWSSKDLRNVFEKGAKAQDLSGQDLSRGKDGAPYFSEMGPPLLEALSSHKPPDYQAFQPPEDTGSKLF